MWISLLSNTLNLFAFSFACHTFLTLKTRKSTYLFVCIAIIFVKIFFPINENPHMNFILTFGSYFVLVYMCYKGLFFQKLLFIVSFSACLMICELATTKVLLLLFPATELSNLYSPYYISGIITTNIFIVYLSKLLSFYFKTFSAHKLPNNFWLILILPVTTIFYIFSISDYFYMTGQGITFILVLIGLLFSNLISIYVFYNVVNSIIKEKNMEKELVESSIKYNSIQNQLKQNNAFFHNIRKQSIEMNDLLEQQNYTDLSHYIQDIYANTIQVFNMINSNFEIADMVINDRLYIIQNNGIQIHTTFETTEFSNYSSLDLEKLFSYLLDVCIHYCLESSLDSKTILIKSKKIRNQSLLVFSFTSLESDEKKIELDMKEQIKELLSEDHCIFSIDCDSVRKMNHISILFNSEG